MNRLLHFLYSYKALIFFLILGFILFSNILNNNFVWLDLQYIVNDSDAQTFNLYNLLDGSSLTGAGYYRPLTAIYLTGIYLIFHQQSFFFHFFQILLYSTSVYFLFLFFKKFIAGWGAFLFAFFFFIHPVNESVVAFISTSGDILSIFFGLFALVLCNKGKPTLWKVVSISTLLLMSTLSKESGILFFIAVILFQFLFNIAYWKKIVVWLSGVFIVYLGLRIIFNGFSTKVIYLSPISRLSLA